MKSLQQRGKELDKNTNPSKKEAIMIIGTCPIENSNFCYITGDGYNLINALKHALGSDTFTH